MAQAAEAGRGWNGVGQRWDTGTAAEGQLRHRGGQRRSGGDHGVSGNHGESVGHGWDSTGAVGITGCLGESQRVCGNHGESVGITACLWDTGGTVPALWESRCVSVYHCTQCCAVI